MNSKRILIILKVLSILAGTFLLCLLSPYLSAKVSGIWLFISLPSGVFLVIYPIYGEKKRIFRRFLASVKEYIYIFKLWFEIIFGR